MTSILDINLDDVPDLTIVDTDEYELSLCGVEIKTSKKGEPYINAVFDIMGEPNAQKIYHIVMLPSDSCDEDTLIRRKRQMKKFYTALGIPLSGQEVDLEDYIGTTVSAFVGVQEGDSEYPESKNNIRRFILPA